MIAMYAIAACVRKEPWAEVRHINHEQTNENQGLIFCAIFEMLVKC